MKHKRTLRRGLSILLSLVLCLTLLPATALAADPANATADFTGEDEESIAIALELLTNGDASKAEWDGDSATPTLTLKGVNFTTNAATAVALPAGAKIVLEGNNTITSTSSSTDTSFSYGIDVRGSLTIEGSGTLTVTGGAAASYSNGLFVSGGVTISGGTVTVRSGEAKYCYGIFADGVVTITGGLVEVTGGASTGTVSNGLSCGIDTASGVVISGGTVTARGGKAPSSYGIRIPYGGEMKISGEDTDITATGGEAIRESEGIHAFGGRVIIENGEVTAEGGTATDDYGGSFGIDAKDMTISGGIVEATGGAETDNSYGICTTGDITISNPAEVTAKGGEAGYYSCGICAGPNMDITGGTVTATASKAGYYSDGIYVSVNMDITGGTVTATAGEVTGEDAKSTGIFWGDDEEGGKVTISGGHVTAQTLAEESTTTTRRALNVEPDLSGYTNCIWRTSSNGSFAAAAYEYSDTHTYVEFSSGSDFTNYGVTVNGVAVTSLNKDDVRGDGLIRYDPATNTVYEKGYPNILTIAGDGSTDVVLGEGTITSLTVTGAKNVKGTNCIIAKGNIACDGDVTLEGNPCVLSALTVTGAQNVTMTNPASGVGYTISGSVTINCSGNVSIRSANDIAVGGSLTVTGARDVTVTANTTTSSLKPAIEGSADITCSGDVTISNTGGGKAVRGTLKYQNAGGNHSYTVETGDSLENLTDYATKEAGETFGPATLDAAAVKISVPHTAGEWQSNSTQHWQICTICENEFNRADHTFSSRTCTVCGYTKPSSSSSSGGTAYSIAVESAKHGTVTLSPKTASKGATVTITVDPDEGYILDELIVTDKNGKEIALTDKGSGKFTFKMPASKVTVEASFVKETARDNTIVLTLGSNTATVFGQTVVNDVAPVARNNRTMLPIRFVAEALGAQVDWNADLQKVTISKPDLLIEIYLGSATAYVNDEAVELDVVAYAENNRTYLPLRFVAENLGATVLWDASTQSITITP